MKKIILLFLGFCIYQKAHSQQDTTQTNIFDLSLEELMKIEIISSSKTSQKQTEAPNVVAVVPKKQLETYNWQSINEILYQQPGFVPSHDYDRRTIGARGLFEGWNNNHLLMMIDGVPVNDNLYGSAYTWEITPLAFAQSVEILRGPGAALYGNNATNGVVSINSISCDDIDNFGFFETRIGNAGIRTLDVITAFKGKHFTGLTSFTTNKTQGEEYDSYDGWGKKVYTTNDKRSNNYFFAKIEGLNSLDGLSFQYHRQDWNYQTGHGWIWAIPVFDEALKESRDIFILKYKTPESRKIEQEYVVKFQNHNIDWNLHYARQGEAISYEMIEYLNTNAQDLFVRLQYAFEMPKNSKLLAGIESVNFFYNQDNEHFANFDVNDVNYPPHEYTGFEKLNPWLEFISGKPVNNIGTFIQYSSGNLLSEKLKLTAGIRYDVQFFDYKAVYTEGQPKKSKSFDQISPRLALVYLPNKKFTIKAGGGLAFRAPTPTEMFGANTWTLASNIEGLKPEEIATADLSFSYRPAPSMLLRVTGFYTDAKNQIAYSTANFNLSTNVYTITNSGIEFEFLFGKEAFSGFANLSYVKRLDEDIFEAEQVYVSEHKNKVTWVPALWANAGFNYTFGKFNFMLSGHYQGKVERRQTDLFSSNDIANWGFSEMPRPEQLEAWISINTKISVKHNFFEFALACNNLTNGSNYLAKNLKYPFDYRMESRRLYTSLKILF